MSIVLHGVPVGAGIAIGRAHLMVRGMDEVPHYDLDDKELAADVLRYEQAIKATRRQLEQLRNTIPENAPAELGAFISLHLMLLNDVTLSREPVDLMRAQYINAEWALKLQADRLAEQFDAIDDDYLRERKQDMLQVVERIYKNLRGLETELEIVADAEDDIILLAHDLAPADTVYFKNGQIAAFVTDVGGPTSHTAILGRSLDMPSVIALSHARNLVRENEWVIVDGTAGVVVVAPDDVVLAEYRQRLRAYHSHKRQLGKLKKSAATTRDGTHIEMLCNIEGTEDIRTLHSLGADGVGLLRSEFAYLNRDNLPDEEELFQIYADLVKKLKGKPLTIRTVDLGVDKNPRWFSHHQAPNPALGLTGIRLCLAEPVMFRTQMCAILRASALGPVKMMWPMIASVEELQRCHLHLQTACKQLRERGQAFDERLPVGMMVEIPSAALTVSSLIRHVDFLSIGTNDLIQYTLAVDRSDESVNYLYQPHHPAVLKLVQHVLRTAAKAQKPVSMCGEMAGDERYTRLLLGLGLRHFSMNVNNLLPVKNRIIQSDLTMLASAAQRIVRNGSADTAAVMLKKLNSQP